MFFLAWSFSKSTNGAVPGGLGPCLVVFFSLRWNPVPLWTRGVRVSIITRDVQRSCSWFGKLRSARGSRLGLGQTTPDKNRRFLVFYKKSKQLKVRYKNNRNIMYLIYGHYTHVYALLCLYIHIIFHLFNTYTLDVSYVMYTLSTKLVALVQLSWGGIYIFLAPGWLDLESVCFFRGWSQQVHFYPPLQEKKSKQT